MVIAMCQFTTYHDYTCLKDKLLLNIKDILEPPGRMNRPERILVLIRGAPGSGKTHLANLIVKKEQEHGNRKCISLKADRYQPETFDKSQEKLLYSLRKVIDEGEYCFIVLEVEGGRTLYVNKFIHTAMNIPRKPYKCYVIELHRPREACLSRNINNRSEKDIDEINQDLVNYRTPRQLLLDPSYLLNKDDTASSSEVSDVSDTWNSLIEFMKEKSVMKIVATQLNSQILSGPRPLMEQTVSLPAAETSNIFTQRSRFDDRFLSSHATTTIFNNFRDDGEVRFQNCPTFVPLKIKNYNHVKRPSFEDSMKEFRVWSHKDYAHRSSEKLKDFISNIDVEKVLLKRKSVVLRRKTLEYLKMAKNPEETVSNPRYPNNWEEIPSSRPPTRNTRKKMLTAKIMRVKASKHEKLHFN